MSLTYLYYLTTFHLVTQKYYMKITKCENPHNVTFCIHMPSPLVLNITLSILFSCAFSLHFSSGLETEFDICTKQLKIMPTLRLLTA